MFIAENPQQYAGKAVGDGHCVALVQEACNAPLTSEWRRGLKVNQLTAMNTAIATFGSQGTYENNTDGSSHAAILVNIEQDGLLVWDQWKGKPTSQRTIRFKNGEWPPCDDGSQYYVIVTSEELF
jgi:hypothetical protein